jgi:hypothetical protein
MYVLDEDYLPQVRISMKLRFLTSKGDTRRSAYFYNRNKAISPLEKEASRQDKGVQKTTYQHVSSQQQDKIRPEQEISAYLA